jgi:hypothetical protein
MSKMVQLLRMLRSCFPRLYFYDCYSGFSLLEDFDSSLSSFEFMISLILVADCFSSCVVGQSPSFSIPLSRVFLSKLQNLCT